MKKILLAALLGATVPAHAADLATGITVWKSADLKAYEKTLSPKIDAQKVAVEDVGKFSHHAALMAHREGDGEAEFHDVQADIFFVQSGEATLVLGGEVVGGKTTAPGEIRGASIKDGKRYPLAAGDVVHIPARTAHHMLVAPGKQITYFVVKIDTPKK